MLIATLPHVHRTELLEKIIAHPGVDAFRYNTGYASIWEPKETLERICRIADRYKKADRLWVDLKGRQLRIREWTAPDYGCIVLNRDLAVKLPARIFFRGGSSAQITAVRGNTVCV